MAVVEGDSGTVDAVFTVSASAVSLTNVQAYYVTSNGTAEAGADYTATSGMVTVAAGTLSTQVIVAVAGDTEHEYPPETFTVNLYNPTNCTISNAVGACTIMDDDAAVYLADFPSRLKITLSGYSGYDTLTNFVALIRLGPGIPGFDYETFASDTGGDLRFSNADGTRLLNHEIEEWDTGGESCVWVQVPELPPGGTHIWARWGNPRETTPPAYTTDGSTWSEGFGAVWHLAEAGGTRRDSTAGKNDASAVGNPTSAAGVIAGAGDFSPETEYLRASNPQNIPSGDEPRSLFAWLKTSDNNGGNLISLGNRTANNRWSILMNGNQQMRIIGQNHDDPTQRGGFADSTWGCVAATYDGATVRYYLDGAPVGTWDAGYDFATTAGNPVKITNNADPSNDEYLSGVVDEVRVCNRMRSADWIKACYDNQVQGSTFVEYSDLFSPKGTLLILR